MKKNYRIVSPPQKFMQLQQIYANFGSKPVVAYGCKVKNNTPTGGYVIAAQNNPGENPDAIKLYMKQLKERFPEKEPIYWICIKEDGITYDFGEGEVKTLPEIMEKPPSKAQKAVDGIPDEILARALASAFKTNPSKTKDG